MAMHASEAFVGDYLESFAGWAIRRNVRYKVHHNYSDLDLVALPTPDLNRERSLWLPADVPPAPVVVQVKWRKTFPYPLSSATDEGFAWWIIGNDKMLREAAQRAAGEGNWDLMLVAPRSTIDLAGEERAARASGILGTLKRADWYPTDAANLRSVRLVTLEEMAGQWARETDADASGWDETPFQFMTRLLGSAGLLNREVLHSVRRQVEAHARSSDALSADERAVLATCDWGSMKDVAKAYVERLARKWDLPQTSSTVSREYRAQSPEGDSVGWWLGRTSRPWWLGLVVIDGLVEFHYWPQGGDRVTTRAQAATSEAIRAAELAWIERCVQAPDEQ